MVFLITFFNQTNHIEINLHIYIYTRGFGKQGYQCRLCGCSVHNQCLDKILTNCALSKNIIEQVRKQFAKNYPKKSFYLNIYVNLSKKGRERFNINLPHYFKEKTFYKPTLCNHCCQIMLFIPGFKCECKYLFITFNVRLTILNDRKKH